MGTGHFDSYQELREYQLVAQGSRAFAKSDQAFERDADPINVPVDPPDEYLSTVELGFLMHAINRL